MAKKKKTPEEELLEQTIAEQTPEMAESTQAMEDEDYSAAATGLEKTPVLESEAAPDDPTTLEGDPDIRKDAAGSGTEWGTAVPDLPPQDCGILSIEPAPIQRGSADGAVCMCSYSYHYEDGEFAVGDKVIVIPQRYENAKKQIYGKIVAKW